MRRPSATGATVAGFVEDSNGRFQSFRRFKYYTKQSLSRSVPSPDFNGGGRCPAVAGALRLNRQLTTRFALVPNLVVLEPAQLLLATLSSFL